MFVYVVMHGGWLDNDIDSIWFSRSSARKRAKKIEGWIKVVKTSDLPSTQTG